MRDEVDLRVSAEPIPKNRLLKPSPFMTQAIGDAPGSTGASDTTTIQITPPRSAGAQVRRQRVRSGGDGAASQAHDDAASREQREHDDHSELRIDAEERGGDEGEQDRAGARPAAPPRHPADARTGARRRTATAPPRRRRR